jgi:hypothetical protein
MIAALRALREARVAAAEHKHDPWEFALSLPALRQAGAGETDIRRLIAAGLIEHAHEQPPTDRRAFLKPATLALSSTSCFVATPAGVQVVESHVDRPRWDGQRRELWYGGRLLKRYRAPAQLQEPIVAAFEEDGWPPRIDDPLPQVPGQDPQARLHDAVHRLNLWQRALVFRRDGTGEGITWETGCDIDTGDLANGVSDDAVVVTR